MRRTSVPSCSKDDRPSSSPRRAPAPTFILLSHAASLLAACSHLVSTSMSSCSSVSDVGTTSELSFALSSSLPCSSYPSSPPSSFLPPVRLLSLGSWGNESLDLLRGDSPRCTPPVDDVDGGREMGRDGRSAGGGGGGGGEGREAVVLLWLVGEMQNKGSPGLDRGGGRDGERSSMHTRVRSER